MTGSSVGDRSMIDSGDIESNGFNWCNADWIDFRVRANEPFLVNTDLKGNPGVHWLACVVLRSSVYLYDPLGPKNKRIDSNGQPTMTTFRITLARNLRNQRSTKSISRVSFHLYPFASQIETTTRCGWFAIFVADLLRSYLEKHPNATASDLDALIESKFGTSADPGDEELVGDAFGID